MKGVRHRMARPGVVRFLKFIREPPAEVADVGDEGVVAASDPLEAAVVNHLGPPRIEQRLPIRVVVEQDPRSGEQDGGERGHAVLLIEQGGQVADVEPARTLAVRAREVRVVMGQARRGKHGQVARIQALHLLPRHADGRGGGDVLRADAAPDEQGVEARLVEPGHRAQGSR